MLEIEQKFAGPPEESWFAGLRAELARLGADEPEHETEIDHYFNAPDRDFVRTGEAFRLRRVGPANRFTYKGPKQAGPVKTRPELEIDLLPGDESARQILTLLGHLGFRFVAVVRKERSSYPLDWQGWPVTVCLDDVAEVGRFAEVEILAPQEQADLAAAAVSSLAARLGLTQVQPRSYLGLLLESRARSDQERQPAVVRTVAELRRQVGEARRLGHTVGLVPTMGALHQGHRSLIEASRSRDGFVVVSIFVNPTQFGPREDLDRYPRTWDEDLALCAAAGVDLIFAPAPEEVYPPGFQTAVEVVEVQRNFEGQLRPGHFRGVATVVLKLFNMTQPDRAYFGQKDAQQATLIRRMVADLDVPVHVMVLPTVREADGLALSSRNRYLDPGQRRQAVVLSRALDSARRCFASGERDGGLLLRAAREVLLAEPETTVDYLALVDPDTFLPVDRAGTSALVVLAVRIGSTRLLDNALLQASS